MKIFKFGIFLSAESGGGESWTLRPSLVYTTS